MSLTCTCLANGVGSPAYVFPATSAAANTEGAPLVLPPSFNSSAIVNADLKKIVETLELYGAYNVDRNDGTQFAIFVESDASFSLMPKGWNNQIARQLDQIHAGLRQVVSAKDFIDANVTSSADAIKPHSSSDLAPEFPTLLSWPESSFHALHGAAAPDWHQSAFWHPRK